MVFAQRIAALQQFVLDGHQVTITYSFSAVSKKLKTKVNVSAEPGIVPTHCRFLLLDALQPTLNSMWNSVIVDRGHTFSDGHACACFWIEPQSVDSGVKVEKEAAANVEMYWNTWSPSALRLRSSFLLLQNRKANLQALCRKKM